MGFVVLLTASGVQVISQPPILHQGVLSYQAVIDLT